MKRFTSLVEFLESLPEDERIIVDVLRQIVQENLPVSVNERLAYNVPFYYGHKRICCIWPSSVKGGGIREGVLLGFWYGGAFKRRRLISHPRYQQASLLQDI